MNQKRIFKSYPKKSKEIVALVVKQGYSVAGAAQSLGIRPNQFMSGERKSKILARFLVVD
jgi:transposase